MINAATNSLTIIKVPEKAPKTSSAKTDLICQAINAFGALIQENNLLKVELRNFMFAIVLLSIIYISHSYN